MRGEGSLLDFGTLLTPKEAAEPILSDGVRGALLEWLTEIWAKEELAAAKLKPRMRAMFDGPPGVGKTTLAHHLAARLGLRMLAIRPDKVIDCWVGSSARNIGRLFDLARAESQPVMMFFDEFDALAPKRGRREQAADDTRNEMVNTLLQRMHAYEGLIIAATNFGTQIDEAIWRRFELQITIDLPGQSERVHILRRYFDPYQLRRANLEAFAHAFEGATPALMRSFCEGLKRQLIVGPKVKWDMRRDVVFERMLASISPHPELAKPRLWTLGVSDAAIRDLPWPLSRDPAADDDTPSAMPPNDRTVVPFRGANP